MLKYLYSRDNSVTRFLTGQYIKYRFEQSVFEGAFLSRLNNEEARKLYKTDKSGFEEFLKKQVDSLDTLEQQELFQIQNSDSLEQCFNILNNLRLTVRHKQLVYNEKHKQLEAMSALIDPDKFPIFSLIESVGGNNQVSLWQQPEVQKKYRDKIGFQLVARKSGLEHHESGEGVFLELNDAEGFVMPGRLLGFVPGVIHESYTDFLKVHRVARNFDEYLHRFDNTIIDFSRLMSFPNDLAPNLMEIEVIREERAKNENIHDSIVDVQPEMINPYALGHKINHPLKGTRPNVTFMDILVPKYFFNETQAKFLPNLNAYDEINDRLSTYVNRLTGKSDTEYQRLVGVFAIDFIQSGQELFVDYYQQEMYDLDHLPDWLQKVESPINIKKSQYETEFTVFHHLINSHFLRDYLKKLSKLK